MTRHLTIVTIVMFILCAGACTPQAPLPPAAPVSHVEVATGTESTPPVADAPAPPDETLGRPTSPHDAPAAPADTKPQTASEAATGGACNADSDCVPASCCHATACVNRAEAPDCRHRMCTMDCRGNTLDCGGSCLCQNGRCTAKVPTRSAM